LKILAIDSDGIAPLIRCETLDRGVRLSSCHRCSAFGGYSGHDSIRCAAPSRGPSIHLDDVRRDIERTPSSDLFESDMDGGDEEDDEG